MKTLRILALALFPMLAMTAQTAPAGSPSQGCGVQAIESGHPRGFRPVRTHPVGERREDLHPLPQHQHAVRVLSIEPGRPPGRVLDALVAGDIAHESHP